LNQRASGSAKVTLEEADGRLPDRGCVLSDVAAMAR
jgi:hypothetical protein